MKRYYFILPLILTIGVVIGMLIGGHFEQFGRKRGLWNAGGNKLDEVIGLIKDKYVEDVSVDSIMDTVLPDVLAQLDPHSSYIKASELEEVNSDLEGSFSGIGVQFSLMNDTITIVDVISGGPSARIGLMPGDRIISIDDTVSVGKKITNEYVFKRLRGTKGTKVKLEIKRSTSEKLLPFTIERGDIPVNSVDASFLAEPGVGYIKVSKFGANTYSEFITALAKLNKEKATRFIIDLRRNTGGYLEAAIRMINEFLPKDRLIVYTEGRSFPRSDALSDGSGSFTKAPIVVLMDEWSASASEIFAGSIQDNDRGMIVGRRSFGKGLVQNQFTLSDGSAVRLTIARYYIPSGRCIQKEYTKGHLEEYEMDFVNRYTHGELFNQDSMKIDKKQIFKTVGGRTVYGGGGIIPDYFVSQDTVGVNSYFNSFYNKGVMQQFCFNYADKNRSALKKFKTAEELDQYLKYQDLVEKIVAFGETKGIRRRPVYVAESSKLLEHDAIALIARNILGEEAFYKLYLKSDNVFEKGLQVVKGLK